MHLEVILFYYSTQPLYVDVLTYTITPCHVHGYWGCHSNQLMQLQFIWVSPLFFLVEMKKPCMSIFCSCLYLIDSTHVFQGGMIWKRKLQELTIWRPSNTGDLLLISTSRYDSTLD